ncbi:MAG: hypothetical protein ABIR81_01060, partial [Ginsengibacter sp.]
MKKFITKSFFKKAAIIMTFAFSGLYLSAQDSAMMLHPVKSHYTVSGGLLGAFNFTKFRVD